MPTDIKTMPKTKTKPNGEATKQDVVELSQIQAARLQEVMTSVAECQAALKAAQDEEQKIISLILDAHGYEPNKVSGIDADGLKLTIKTK